MDVFEGPTTEGEPSYVVRDRSTPFIEFPFGVGGAIDVWPRWLSLVIELTAAPVVEQGGNALETFQTIDASGRKQPVGPYPDVAGHFVQTIGLSLLL